MNNLTEVLNSGGAKFIEFALPMLIQSSVLIVILLAADLLLRKKVRATFRYWLWMLVLVKLVLPPSLTSPVSFGSIVGDKIAVSSLQETAPAASEKPTMLNVEVPTKAVITKPLDASGTEADSAEWSRKFVEVPVMPAAAPTAQPTEKNALGWRAIVLVVWAGAAAAMLLLVIQRLFFVLGLIRQAQPAEGLLPETLEFCRTKMAVNLPVTLKVSANATSPAVCGLFRPVILVPNDLAPSLGAGHLRPVLLHELGHIKRGDLWVNLVQTVLQIIYFYNPLLWLANAVIRRIREQAVDEMVQVAMGEKAEDYPQTLLSVAKLAFGRPALALRFIGVVESRSQLKGRIKKMLNQPVPKTAKLGLTGLAAIILTAAVLLPMATATENKKVKATENTEIKAEELVEDFFKHNYRDITDRKTIEWGEPQIDENGNVSIRYKYEATIWDKDKIIQDKVWTFDSQGNFLWVRDTGAEDIYSPAGAQAIVEDFFANNYRDITDRKTIEWGEPEKDESGNVSIRYKYEATIWGKDKIIENKIFTFDKDGRYVSATNVEGFPKKLDANGDRSNVAPRVVSTNPVCFSNDVSADLKYIEVTFDQEMMDSSWSWTGGGDTYPKTTGEPQYDKSTKTCRLPVALEPGKAYWVGINSVSFKNFRSKSGVPAPWYAIVFATADVQGNPTPIPDDMLAEARRINARAAIVESAEPAEEESTEIPQETGSKIELKYDDGTSAGKWSFSGGGHGVKFTAPNDGCLLKSVKIYGSRYGEYEAPNEDFNVWVYDKNFNIIRNFKFPYSLFAKRGYTDWVTLDVNDTKVPKEFAICVAFDPHQTKGIYVYHDDKGSGHSYQGIPPEMKPFKDGDWMIRAIVKLPDKNKVPEAGNGSLQSMIDAPNRVSPIN